MMQMLFMTDVVKPTGMSDSEFFRIWNDEAKASAAAIDSGAITHLWKAAGQYKVIGVFDFPDGEAMDAALHQLPIWKDGHHEMAKNIQWIPLRPYKNRAVDLQKLSSE